MPPEPVRITDLAAPRFSAEIAAIRKDMRAMADDCVLDADALRSRAAAELGLGDFGGTEFEAPLEALLRALEASPVLSPVGRVMVHAQILQLLKNRLLLADLLRRHPEIHDIEIEAPIVIAGLPRTGTTHLHNLMAADPTLRSLPYWESLEPVLSPTEAELDPDPRLERTEMALWFVNETMPCFKRMHEMTTEHVHEEIQLLAMEFSTVLFETTVVVPDYRDFYLAHDQTPHYRYLKTVLQAMQFQRGGSRWVLKSPQHLEQFGPLTEVFPDATFVVTHRDPVSVCISMATMIAYTARMQNEGFDPAAIGRYWADRLEVMLRACDHDRGLLPPEQSVDVSFDEFMADDISMVRRIYELAGHPFDDDTRAAMDAYMTGHPRGRLGPVEYHASDVGLDQDDLARRFDFYSRRFF